jgi:ketosteroid isomerase-like protein
MYGQFPPLVNASRPPGEWQAYDIVFTSPRFGPGGRLEKPAIVTVLHNGIVVHDATPFWGPTAHKKIDPYTPDNARGPIALQDHGNPVRYRNVWIRPVHADATASESGDARTTVAALDTQYQAAVKANDAAAMDRILADDFVLVTGRGQSFTKRDLLTDARNKTTIYEHQEEEAGSQTVRVWGDTAVVTALLWIKGTRSGSPIDYKLWFSDTYVRTPQGWRYAFGQASIALPKAP